MSFMGWDWIRDSALGGFNLKRLKASDEYRSDNSATFQRRVF